MKQPGAQRAFTFLSALALAAALAGCGIAFLPGNLAAEHIQSGRLVQVMPEFCKPFEPLYAFYPSRRHSSRALGLVIDAIRHPG